MMLSFKQFITENDMTGMSVGSGHKRPVDKGAGMTKRCCCLQNKEPW